MLEPSLRWLNYTVETELLMNEIEDSDHPGLDPGRRGQAVLAAGPGPVPGRGRARAAPAPLLMLSDKLNGITVRKEFDKSLPKIPAYAAELNQVWTNLIDNAVQAMGGSGTLTLRTSRDDNECIVVEIGDTGPGIPPDIQRRIFEPFFTTKPVGEGTGLGLDIAWRIVVNKHHGDLRVESVPGDTRFQVLPSGRSVTARKTRRQTHDRADPGVDPAVAPSGTGCVECEAAGGWWLHLRRCTQCGHIGCCDNSPSQHATAHPRRPATR
jgi:hypothetical protein